MRLAASAPVAAARPYLCGGANRFDQGLESETFLHDARAPIRRAAIASSIRSLAVSTKTAVSRASASICSPAHSSICRSSNSNRTASLAIPLRSGCAVDLRHHLNIRLQPHHGLKAFAKDCVIVRNYQANHLFHRSPDRHFDFQMRTGLRHSWLIFSEPPHSATREAIAQGGVLDAGKPTPSSSMVILMHITFFTGLDYGRARFAMAPGIPYPFQNNLKDLLHHQAAPAERRVDPKACLIMTHRERPGSVCYFLIEIRERSDISADFIILPGNSGPKFGQFIQSLLRALPH